MDIVIGGILVKVCSEGLCLGGRVEVLCRKESLVNRQMLLEGPGTRRDDSADTCGAVVCGDAPEIAEIVMQLIKRITNYVVCITRTWVYQSNKGFNAYSIP